VGKEWHDTSFEQWSQHKIKADPQEPVLYGAFIGHKSALCRPSTWVLFAVGNWLVTPLMERDPQTYCPWLWLTDMWAMRVVGLTCQWVKVRGQHITWSHFHHWYTGGARHRPTWAPAPLGPAKKYYRSFAAQVEVSPLGHFTCLFGSRSRRPRKQGTRGCIPLPCCNWLHDMYAYSLFRQEFFFTILFN
jgi:hypothetical protein